MFFEVGFFLIQWMLKTNIPTSPFPLWDRMIRSKRDILLLHLNNLQTVYRQNKGALFCASLKCVFKKKNYFFGAANVKSQKGMILAGELQFYQLPIGISLLTPCCKRGNTTKAKMDARSIQHPPMLGQSITISRCNTLSVPKKNGERGTSWEQMWASKKQLMSKDKYPSIL